MWLCSKFTFSTPQVRISRGAPKQPRTRTQGEISNAETLGEASPLAKLIRKQLKEGALQQQQPASAPPASTAFSSFWKKQAQLLAASLQSTLADVAALEENPAAGSLEEAWPEEQPSQEAWEEPAGRFDGSELSLASGFGNQPLDLKMKLAEGLGTFRP